MYDPKTTQRKIAEACYRIPDWQPKYHSQAQIAHAIAHLDTLWDPEQKRIKRPSGKLTKDEFEFIQNERRLCALDFRGYWLPNYAWIINWYQQPERFKPNVAQSIIMDLWGEREALGVAIWMLQLKARRLGVSTLSELAVQHRFQFWPHSNCVVASADPTKSLEMAGIIDYCLKKQPWWLLPQGKPKIYQGMPVEYPDIDTGLTIQAGNQFTGVARGSTPNVIHLSEMSSWPDAREQIDGSLMRAVVDSSNVFAIMETTAWGTGNWVHDTWEIAKEETQEGRSRLLPVFLPWFVGTDLYPSKADLLARPIDPKWVPSDRVVAHAERARQYVSSNPLLFKYLAKGNRDWRMPREQMWYHEIEYASAKKKKELNIFLSELPADDFEAFQSPNLPLIDPEILMGYQERTRIPIGVYTIIGPDIPPALIIPRRHWDETKAPISISTRGLLPKYDVKYQLIPVKFHGYPGFDPFLKLLVWEWPDPDYVYGVGVDCSEGIGQDRAVIEVLREATPRREPGQVAEWASPNVTAFQLWPFVMAVASMYSTFRPMAGRQVQCRLAIECWTNGEATQLEIKKRGWSNFHPWKPLNSRKTPTDDKVNRIGIFTNAWFRAQMFDMMLTALSEESIDLPSPYIVQEFNSLEKEGDKQKPQAASGKHDDRVMAIGFPLYSLHIGKPPSKQYGRKRVSFVPGGETEEKPRYPIYQQEPPTEKHAPMAMQVQRSVRGQMELVRSLNRGMPRGFQ